MADERLQFDILPVPAMYQSWEAWAERLMDILSDPQNIFLIAPHICKSDLPNAFQAGAIAWVPDGSPAAGVTKLAVSNGTEWHWVGDDTLVS